MSRASQIITTAVTVAWLAVICGCSVLASRATSSLSANLGSAIRDQNDPETVRQAAPAFLVLIDGLIADAPDDPDLLGAGAELYSTYAGAFVVDPDRAKRLSTRGRDYSFRALCAGVPRACGIADLSYADFEQVIETIDERDLDLLYGAAGAWATWIQAHRSDWSAIADKARVDAMIQRVIEVDPGFDRGGPYLYLGVLATLLPEALGGKPQEGRAFFERAIELSGERNLMAKVLLAREYARLAFDRELHDRLCHEVLDASVDEPGLTLANALAQDEARRLLGESDEWFGD